MNTQMILSVIVILVVGFIYLMNRKTVKKYYEQPMKYDLVIKFNDSSFKDIRNIENFQKIADWSQYGEYGFRGFSILQKEELEQFVCDNLELSKESFKVVSANPGLYLPS